ncbi:MAG: terpene cyclase/mutase family protein, partial [Lentisphaerae bacterium]|nr:terpene cyclase/mutase family protein [Lentisphaerota bacterium]
MDFKMTFSTIALMLAVALSAGAGPPVSLTATTPPAGVVPRSLANEANAAVTRGLDWLAANQRADGSWSNRDFPALTALPLWAFIRAGQPQHTPVVSNGVAFLLSCVRDDGGIYRTVPGRKGGGLSNYNTAICMMVLHAAGDPELAPVVRDARAFIAG